MEFMVSIKVFLPMDGSDQLKKFQFKMMKQLKHLKHLEAPVCRPVQREAVRSGYTYNCATVAWFSTLAKSPF